jgi:hypothetical protein
MRNAADTGWLSERRVLTQGDVIAEVGLSVSFGSRHDDRAPTPR